MEIQSSTCLDSFLGRRTCFFSRPAEFPRQRTSVHKVQRTFLRHFFRLKFAISVDLVWAQRESHSRPAPCKGDALLLSYAPGLPAKDSHLVREGQSLVCYCLHQRAMPTSDSHRGPSPSEGAALLLS